MFEIIGWPPSLLAAAAGVVIETISDRLRVGAVIRAYLCALDPTDARRYGLRSASRRAAAVVAIENEPATAPGDPS